MKTLKRLNAFLIAHLFLLACCLAQPCYGQDTSTTSLNDTLDWIKAKIPAWGKGVSTNTMHYTVSFDDSGMMKVTMKVREDASIYDVFSVGLSDLDADHVRVIDFTEINKSPDATVTLYTKNSAKIVKYTQVINGDARLIRMDEGVTIFVPNKDYAERLAKAFRHAIQLSKEKDPF